VKLRLASAIRARKWMSDRTLRGAKRLRSIELPPAAVRRQPPGSVSTQIRARSRSQDRWFAALRPGSLRPARPDTHGHGRGGRAGVVLPPGGSAEAWRRLTSCAATADPVLTLQLHLASHVPALLGQAFSASQRSPIPLGRPPASGSVALRFSAWEARCARQRSLGTARDQCHRLRWRPNAERRGRSAACQTDEEVRACGTRPSRRARQAREGLAVSRVSPAERAFSCCGSIAPGIRLCHGRQPVIERPGMAPALVRASSPAARSGS
jgi:hypothetical protein